MARFGSDNTVALIGVTRNPQTLQFCKYYSGVIDELRVSDVPRYIESFTPERRFERDEHTVALYHFDEGSGDVLKDSSGNGYHGKICGATWVEVDDNLKPIGTL